MEAVSTAITTGMGLVSDMLTAITGNSVLVVVLAFGFIGLACKVLRKLMRTAKM